MNKQQGLTPAELEVTQKIQMHFPRGLSREVLNEMNGCRTHVLTGAIRMMMNELVRYSIVPSGLSFIQSVEVDHVPKFVVGDHIKRGQTCDIVIISSLIGDDFENRFLPKIEENVVEWAIQVCELFRDTCSADIIKGFGKNNRVETAMAHIWQILRAQGRGEKEGVLLVDGSFNVFFSRDIDDLLWSITAKWREDGWVFCADSIKSRNLWKYGTRILRS